MKTRVERARLRCSVNGSVSKVLKASANLRGAPRAVYVSPNNLFEDVADKVHAETGQAWIRMLCFLYAKYANSVGKIRISMVRDNDDVLRNVACCTALISILFRKIAGLLPVEDESETVSTGTFGPVETSGVALMDCEVQLQSLYL